MTNFPVAAKFFLAARRVVVIGLVRNPNPNTLRVLKTGAMLVRLPAGTVHRVVEGRARLINPGGVGAHRIVYAVLRYEEEAAGGGWPDGDGDEAAIETAARLRITIRNKPAAEPEEDLPIVVDDPQPQPGGNPPLDGDIDLYA